MYSHCAYMLHARSPFHCDGSWYLLNDLFKCADRFACVRLVSELKSREVQGRQSWRDITQGPGPVPGPDIQHVRGGNKRGARRLLDSIWRQL